MSIQYGGTCSEFKLRDGRTIGIETRWAQIIRRGQAVHQFDIGRNFTGVTEEEVAQLDVWAAAGFSSRHVPEFFR